MRGKDIGCVLSLDQAGNWSFTRAGQGPSGRISSSPGTWYGLKIIFDGPDAVAFIDGVRVAYLHACDRTQGYVAIGSSYDLVDFDNLSIKPIEPRRAANGCGPRTGTATSSSDWDDDFTADRALDGDPRTRWNSAQGTTGGEWIELDLGASAAFNQIAIQQFEDRITSFRMQYLDGSEWQDIFSGGKLGVTRRESFPTVTARRVRLLIESTNGQTPSICEFQLHYCRRIH